VTHVSKSNCKRSINTIKIILRSKIKGSPDKDTILEEVEAILQVDMVAENLQVII